MTTVNVERFILTMGPKLNVTIKISVAVFLTSQTQMGPL